MTQAFTIFYFLLLGYLAIYGFHIYWLIYLYFKHKPALPSLPPDPGTEPMVTVQLPVYNERLVVKRLIQSVAAFDWHKDKFEIQILDDSTDSTSDIISNEVFRLKQQGLNIYHIQRDHRKDYKAGALKEGLKQAKGEYIAIFDSDNLPRPDFLKKLIGYFSDSRIGMVQARWSFLNRSQSILCRAQALFLDAHFFVEQAARSRAGLFMNFNGTAGIWRKNAIEDAGSWQGDTLTEDLDLSYRAQLAGWKMILAEEVDVPTELPSTIRGFKTQQYRWARGAVETGRKNMIAIFKSKAPFKIKIGAWFHLTQKTMSLAVMMLSLLLVPAVFLRWEVGGWKLLLIDLPIFIAGTGSMSLFYGLAYKRQKEIHNFKNMMTMSLLSAMGVALSINNSFATLSAIFSKKRIFYRTPKSGVTDKISAQIPKDYKIKFDYTMNVEVLLALYSVIAMICAFQSELYASLPFLTIFTLGFTFFFTLSLRDKYA